MPLRYFESIAGSPSFVHLGPEVATAEQLVAALQRESHEHYVACWQSPFAHPSQWFSQVAFETIGKVQWHLVPLVADSRWLITALSQILWIPPDSYRAGEWMTNLPHSELRNVFRISHLFGYRLLAS